MKKTFVIIVFAVLLVSGTCLAEKVIAEQPVGFRNNLEHTGVYDTAGVPVFHGVKWKFKTGGPLYSSPTIVDGVAFIGSEDSNLYAINLADGTEKWRFKTQGPIKSTPAVMGEIVLISSRDGYLYAIKTKNGKLIWKYKAEQEDKRHDPWDYWQGSPVIYQDQVFFGGWDGKIYALKIDTGDLVQTYQVGRTHSTPTIANGKLYVGTFGDKISAYDLNTAAEVWTVSGGFAVYASIVYEDGLIYVGLRGGVNKNGVRAYDAETGACRWAFDSPGQSSFIATPAIANGIVYAGSWTDQSIYALDGGTGQLLWHAQVNNSVHSSPAYNRGVLYFATSDNVGWQDTGVIYAMDSLTGETLWTYETYGLIESSPVLNDGVLYIGSNDGYLYAIY